MIERPTKRIIPHRGHFFVVEVEGHEPHDMRLPSPPSMEAVYAMMDTQRMRNLSETVDADRPVASLQTAMSEVAALQGAMIGCCWYNVVSDLESKWDGKPDTLDEYGRAVYDELWHAGHNQITISVLFAACLQRFTEMFATQREVLDLMGFMRPRQAGAIGASSTSGESTSATSSAGPA